MDKLTYLAELAEGLARWVPERERQDILRYYAEYFEEAGPEREVQVVQELGDPWALSCRLAVEGGYVTWEQANSWTPPKKKKWPWVLLGTAAVLVFVVSPVVSAASQIGRVVGRFVGSDTPVEQVTVVDNYAAFEEADSMEGTAFYEMDGGFWSMEDGCLEPFWAIDANISFGNITITAGEDYTLAIQQNSNLGGYSVKWEVQGDTLKIRDGSSGSTHVGLDGLEDLIGQKGLDVIITVPEGEVLQKVTAKTDFGNVYLSGLDVEVKTTAKTAMGNVECYDIRTAEKVELKTDMGNVTFGVDELYDGVDIELKTSLGDVEAILNCYERDCEYKLETGLGSISINGDGRGGNTKAERKGNCPYKLDAESSLGDVEACFRDDRWQ